MLELLEVHSHLQVAPAVVMLREGERRAGLLELVDVLAVGDRDHLHLLPDAVEKTPRFVFSYVLTGIAAFLVIEKFLHWRHCHMGRCDAHAFTYLNLFGDGVHNLIDGMIIATSFLTDLRLGIATTIAVAAHEIPQELGDFGILVYGGFSKTKAILYNLATALTCIVGALIAYFAYQRTGWLEAFLIPFTAGGFIYIALVDMIPELHKRRKGIEPFIQIASIAVGLCLMWVIKLSFQH